jgi:cyclopropane-fatty-acyl-phospholipid synthase
MTSTETSFGISASTSPWPTLSRLLHRAIRARLSALPSGSIDLTLPDGRTIHHNGSCPGPSAELAVWRWRALCRILFEGELGLARSYIDGDISSPDITALIAFGTHNSSALGQSMPSSRLNQWIARMRHWRRTNTRRGSRRNIAAHYDLGNAFYLQWLDCGMTYSSALYTSGEETLEAAQDAKLHRIAELLDVQQGQHVLEIGCGWGSLAEHLIKHHRCTITGLTLSSEQQAYAHARLDPRSADIRLQDYRELRGRYERIASVEMLEAVGEHYWPVYFKTLRRSLTETGTAVLQVITIDESRFESYRRQPDFIQRFIFPGGMLPTVEIIRREAEGAGLRLTHHEGFGSSYARTVAEWRHRFLRAWPEIERLGFDARFKRMWEYYLAYCEAGFDAGLIDVGLFKLSPR